MHLFHSTLLPIFIKTGSFFTYSVNKYDNGRYARTVGRTDNLINLTTMSTLTS